MENIIKWGLLLLLFSPLLYFVFKHKKWYLYLPCALVGVLPDSCAIELSETLPLLTISRILILVLLVFWLCRQWKNRHALFGSGIRGFWQQLSIPVTLLIYTLLMASVYVVNFRWGIGNEIRHLAILLLEQFLLALMICRLVDDRQELDHCFDAMILAWTAVSVIGIVQTIFNFDITTALEFIPERVSATISDRMHMTRAFGTTNAIAFGCHCALLSLIMYYRLERTGRQRYSLAIALTVAAMLCSLSRSSWLCFLGVFGLIFLTRPIKLLKRIWPSVAALALILCLLFSLNGQFYSAMKETAKSTLNTVLSFVQPDTPAEPSETTTASTPATESNTKPSLTETSPSTTASTQASTTEPSQTATTQSNNFLFSLSEDFGLNGDNATFSRMVQWTAVQHMADEGYALFGYGYRARLRDKIYYNFTSTPDQWTLSHAVDVGFVAIACENGLVGLALYLALYLCIFFVALCRKGKRGTFPVYKLFAFLVPMFFALNIASSFTDGLWVIIGLFYSSVRLDKLGLPDSGEPAPKGFRF